MTAADHALAAADAAGAGRTLPVEIRIGVLNAGVTEIDAHACVTIRFLDSQPRGELAQKDVAVGVKRHISHAEHPLCSVVVRGEIGLPVGQVTPPRVLEERVAGAIERVRITEAAATDARARHNQDVREQRHPHDPAQAESRREKVAPRVPSATREILIAKARPTLQHPH